MKPSLVQFATMTLGLSVVIASAVIVVFGGLPWLTQGWTGWIAAIVYLTLSLAVIGTWRDLG